ncbi:MAG: hypothetical protein IJX99_09325 [Clostridia bacterium]|nr:hypothetical protein [Clostridia bacterium]
MILSKKAEEKKKEMIKLFLEAITKADVKIVTTMKGINQKIEFSGNVIAILFALEGVKREVIAKNHISSATVEFIEQVHDANEILELGENL